MKLDLDLIKVKFYSSIKDIPFSINEWNDYCTNPFSKPKLFSIFEDSKVIGSESGWNPLYLCLFKDERLIALQYTFIKMHSYGEFIFDWAWADFYYKNSIPYYPKLLSAIPFSPINAPKILIHPEYQEFKSLIQEKLLDESLRICKLNNLSGYHHLFSEELTHPKLIQRSSIQFHFENHFEDFNDFLNSLKSRKRKNITKERKAIKDSKISIKEYTQNFPDEIYTDIYLLYLNTIDKKYSQAYLNLEFFKYLFEQYQEHLLLYLAYDGDELIAMSLFLKSQDTLYGRYWGAKRDDYQFLHFEMCYYLGLEYCFKHQLKLFEAGAQGEQKLLRGFKAVEIKSLHYLSISQIHQLIENYIHTESEQNQEQIKNYNDYLPYK